MSTGYLNAAPWKAMAPALLLAVAAGLAQALALATPWDGQPLWGLQCLALAVLAYQLLAPARSVRQAFGLGWAFATAWLVGTFWWLYISMHTYGGLAAPLTALAILGLAGFLALYYAAACALFKRLAPGHWLAQVLLFALLWLGAELARGVWFTGFPWGAIGYAHIDGPLAAYAPWLGVYGVGVLAAALAMALARMLQLVRPGGQGGQRAAAARWSLGLMALLMLALLLAVPRLLQPFNARGSESAGRLGLTLLQGSIPQDEKFQQGSGVPMALQWYRQELLAASTPLVVAPETAIPLLPSDLPAGYLEALQARFATGQQAALVGIPLGSMDEGYTNSAVGLVPGNGTEAHAAYRYDKHHLVPFGEFIPPLFRWFTELMNIPLGDFNRGAVGQPSFAWQGQRLAPNICYEDLFGEELGARFADPAQAPTVFINLSNIGWFGDGLAMDQHLLISRFRTLEFSRPMVRATNTGATVVIDHLGRVTAELPRSTRAVLRTEVEGRNGVTPFAWWVSRFGLWPLWALVALALGLGEMARRRRA